MPDPGLVEVFQMKYDYHNARCCSRPRRWAQSDASCPGGRWSAGAVKDAFQRDSLRDFTEPFRRAVTQAQELLNAGGDPQLADFVLDKAYFEEMHAAAEAAGSAFLQGYVRLLTDATNLRSAVRSARMGKGKRFSPSGAPPTAAAWMRVPWPAARRPVRRIPGGSARRGRRSGGFPFRGRQRGIDRFERACDDAVMAYPDPRPPHPVWEAGGGGLLVRQENEFTAIRTILSGRMAGLDTGHHPGRLREAYV